MRKFLIMTLFMLLGMSLNAKNVSIKDIIGNWIFVPNEGTVMAGDIIMKISDVSISQKLNNEKSGAKMTLFEGSYYLSDTPATSWNNDNLGKSQSGSYMVMKINGNMSQNEISFDSEGLLVLVPYDSKNGLTMRFRKMDNYEESTSKTDEAMNLLNDIMSLVSREKESPMLMINSPSSLLYQMDDFISNHDTKEMTTLRVGGPINGIDLMLLKLSDGYDQHFPKLNTLDLSMAWFVTDTIAYTDHEFSNCNHDYFSKVHGMHMVKNLKTDNIGVVYNLHADSSVNVCYDKYGWLVEEKRDSVYHHFCTTFDDCVSERAFFRVPWLEKIILPFNTREIHWQAFGCCPKLREITIPASVKNIYNYAFIEDSALAVVKVEEGSEILQRLRDDLSSGNNSRIFYKSNPNLRIETYSTKKPDVTFTIRGRKQNAKYPTMVFDCSNYKKLKMLEPSNTSEFSLQVTVPQYSIISFGNGRRQAIVAEGGDVYIDLENDSLSGTPLNDKLHWCNKKLAKYEEKIKEAKIWLDGYACEDSTAIFKARYDAALEQLYNAINAFVIANYNNCLSAYMLTKYYRELPNEMSRELMLMCNPDIASDPLLRNEWEWARESSRTVHLDSNGYSDPRFMQSLTNEKAGQLNTMLTEEQWKNVKRLKVSGPINTLDIDWLKWLCRDRVENSNWSCRLRALDLSDAYIVDLQGNPSTYMPEKSFAGIPWLKYMALPKNITVIGKRCFYENHIEEIKMYDNVQIIEDEAFASSTELHKLKLSANLKKIGKMAFWQCTDIREMTLPDKVSEIGKGAFSLCRNLYNLHIPASTKLIGAGITGESPNVTITVDKANKEYKVISNVIVACTDAARDAIGQTNAKYFASDPVMQYTTIRSKYKMVNGKKVLVSQKWIKK